MPHALLEIGTEEIPARFMPRFLEDLKRQAQAKLKEARLKYKELQTLGTPRRLALYIQDLASRQEDLVEEVKGPPKEAAYDKEAKPTPAAMGFAKSRGVKIKDLIVKSVEKREYVFAKILEKGLPAEKVLPGVFPKIITSLYLPLSMKWGTGEFRFIRPIHWIVALYGGKVIKFQLAGIKSSNLTQGHRFLGKKKVAIKEPKVYIKALAKNHVMVDQNHRVEMVRRGVATAAKRYGKALLDEDLLTEVTYLIEYPLSVLCRFDPRFLELPQDVLITVMKKNQKYFPIQDSKGRLLSAFVVVVNGVGKKSIPVIREGNERVLTARLSDAKFFYDEDMKIHFFSRIEDLKKVAFLEKLGTVYDRTERVIRLSLWIAKSMGLEASQVTIIKRIAQLSKADLVTHMVKEFSELEGTMGREYALKAGEDKKVALGIYEHYLPRHPKDKLPTVIEGAVVSLADKIDSIVGCFSLGLIPTGSEDPYGLRRQAHGIVSTILGKKIDLPLSSLIRESYETYKTQLQITTDYRSLQLKVMDFLAGRLKGMLLEEKVRYDVVEAVLSGWFEDLLDSWERAKTMMQVIGTDWFKGVFYTGDRLARLAVKAKRDQVVAEDFVEDTTRNLYKLFLEVKGKMEKALKEKDYPRAMKELAVLTQPVDDFFVKVMVMVEDEKLRFNRLALLKTMENTYRKIADFTKLAM